MLILERINCPICAGGNNREVMKAKDFRYNSSSYAFSIVKCDKCGLSFLSPRPLKEDIFKFYPDSFYQNESQFLYKLVEPFFKIAVKRMIKFIKNIKSTGRSLDIGCGNGSFVGIMLNNSFDAWGNEPNKNAEESTDSNIAKRVFYEELKNCNFPANSFDIITCFQSLEHVHDINDFLKEIRRILKEDGVLYLSVPNTDFIEYKIFRGYSYNLEVPRHLYFFNRRSISGLLSKHNFKSRFFAEDFFAELVSTPASFCHGLRYLLLGKVNNAGKKFILAVAYLPFVVIKMCFSFLSFFNSQNIKVLCQKT